MSAASLKQEAYLDRLAKQAGFDSKYHAAEDYGISLHQPLLSREASKLIDWLLTDKPSPKPRIDYASMMDKVDEEEHE
jgi:hypothetical protein